MKEVGRGCRVLLAYSLVSVTMHNVKCSIIFIFINAKLVLITCPNKVSCLVEEMRVREVVVCPKCISDEAFISGRDIVRESDM